jgi:hypothetical protein
LAYHRRRGTLVTRNDHEPGAQRTERIRIKAGWTDERQRCDPFRMRLREARDIRQHGGRKVGALDPQMVENLYETVGHRKICFCRHVPTPSLY